MSVLRRKRGLPAVLLVLLLAACGGGGGGNSSGGPVAVTPEIPASRSDAARFLTQATFGPTDADIDRVMAVGYGAWIDEQLAVPPASHRASWEARTRSSRPRIRPQPPARTACTTASGSRPSPATTSCASAWPSRCRRSS